MMWFGALPLGFDLLSPHAGFLDSEPRVLTWFGWRSDPACSLPAVFPEFIAHGKPTGIEEGTAKRKHRGWCGPQHREDTALGALQYLLGQSRFVD